MLNADLIEDLQSSDWNRKIKAEQYVFTLSSISDIKLLFAKFLKCNNSLLYSVFLKLSHQKLSDQNLSLHVELFCSINSIIFSGLEDVVEKSKVFFDDFLELKNFSHYYKIEVFRNVWRRISKEERIFLTTFIKDHRLVLMAPLVLQNFQLENAELIKMSLKAMGVCRYHNSVKFFHQLLKDNQNVDLTLVVLENIQFTGNLFSYYYIYPFLHSKDENILKLSFLSIIKIYGDYSIYLIRNPYKKIKISEVKYEILKYLKKNDSLIVLKFLIDEYLCQDHHGMLLRLEWSIHEVSNKIKIPYLIKVFHSLEGMKKYKILSLITGMYDESLFSLFVTIIRGNYDEMLKILAIDSIHAFNKRESIPLLEKYLESFNDQYSYYALLSIFSHECLDAVPFIEEVVKRVDSSNYLINQLVLSKISKISSLKSPIIIDFIYQHLKGDSLDFVVQAIDSCKQIDSFFLQSKVMDLFFSYVDNEDILNSIRLWIKSQITLFPSFIRRYPKVFLDQRIIDLLDNSSDNFLAFNSIIRFYIGNEDNFKTFIEQNHIIFNKFIEKHYQECSEEWRVIILHIIVNHKLMLSDKFLKKIVFHLYEDLEHITLKVMVLEIISINQWKYCYNFFINEMFRLKNNISNYEALIAKYLEVF